MTNNIVKFKYIGLLEDVEKTRVLSNTNWNYVDVSKNEDGKICLEYLSSVIVLEKDMLIGFIETLKNVSSE